MPRLSVDDHLEQLRLDLDFRAQYAQSLLATDLALFIKERRQALRIGQIEFARAMETSQSRISQMEDPSYGKFTLSTLARAAEVLDCDLEVRLVPRDQSHKMPESLHLPSHQNDPAPSKNVIVRRTPAVSCGSEPNVVVPSKKRMVA